MFGSKCLYIDLRYVEKGENLREETFANLSRIHKIKSMENAAVWQKLESQNKDSYKKISKKRFFSLLCSFSAINCKITKINN